MMHGLRRGASAIESVGSVASPWLVREPASQELECDQWLVLRHHVPRAAHSEEVQLHHPPSAATPHVSGVDFVYLCSPTRVSHTAPTGEIGVRRCGLLDTCPA
jgi:hypothetical protein